MLPNTRFIIFSLSLNGCFPIVRDGIPSSLYTFRILPPIPTVGLLVGLICYSYLRGSYGTRWTHCNWLMHRKLWRICWWVERGDCMAYICVLSAKEARGTNLNKNISGKFLILILVTKTINSNKFFNNMIFSSPEPKAHR